MARDVVAGFFDVVAVRVAVDQDGIAAASAEQVVDRRVERLALDVPQRHVDRGDGGHGDGTAAPVRSAIEVLPDVFGLEGVAVDDARE